MSDRMRLTDTSMGNGARVDPLPRGDMLRVEPPATAPRRRLPELVLGIFLVAGCALAALVLAADSRGREAVLALSRDVGRGEEISADDLRVVYVGHDDSTPIAYLEEGDENEVVGKATLADLPAGTLITPSQVTDPSAVLDQGFGIVGLALEVGEMPTTDLAPGDMVKVVAGANSPGEEAQMVGDGAEATVVSVERIEDDSSTTARWAVSLRATEDAATQIAEARSGDNPVQLVLVQR
jgi:Flp pilus assembly protein CpaB